MSFISLFLRDIVDRKLDYVEYKLFENILPTNLSDESRKRLAFLLKNNPTIASELYNFKTEIFDQIEFGAFMFINALIGLVPVPIIPGLIRTSNNTIFQMLKTADRVLQFREIINVSLEMLDDDPKIKGFLENKGIDMDKLNPDTDIIMSDLVKSAKKEFKKIDREFLQGGELTPSEIYDRINKLAAERDRNQNTKIPPVLPPPKDTTKSPVLPPPKDTTKSPVLPPSKDTTKSPVLPPSKDTTKPLALPPPKDTTKPLALPPPKDTTKSLALPPPNSSKNTQKAGKKIKNKKQKKYYKKTKRNKYKK